MSFFDLEILNLTTNTMTVFLLFVLLLMVGLLVTERLKFVKQFDHIPGPRAIPGFGNALQLTGSQADFFKQVQIWSKQYDGMFRLWVGQAPFVFLSKPQAIQPLLNSSVHIEKSQEYKLLDAFLGNGLITSTGGKWHAKRKLLTPVFHYDILEDYLQPVLKESTVLVQQLSREVGSLSFDVVPYAKLAALDIICELTLGYQLNSQINSNLKYVHAIEEYMSIQQRRFITPWLKSKAIYHCTPYAAREKKCLEILNRFSENVIREKKEELKQSMQLEQLNEKPKPKKTGKVFLDLLFNISQNGSILSDKDLRDEVNTFIFAGHDTVSMTVSWCLYVLGTYPEVQEEIVKELSNKMPAFDNSYLKVSDISELKYLDCCIKEVLRLYPTTPLIARHLNKSLTIDDQTIPAGTSVLVNIFGLHRNAEVFSEPEKFIPERFLDKECDRKNLFGYVPFSAGPRNCIGQKLAMLTMKVILANILKNYKVQSVERAENLKLVSEVVLINEGGIKIMIDRRR